MRVTSHRRTQFLFRPSSTLVLLLCLTIGSGCGDSVNSPSSQDPDRPTLGEAVAEGENEDQSGGDIVSAPEEREDTIATVLSFDAGPGFCCNPLTIEFNAGLSGASEPGRAVFRWDFGDGRTGEGDSTQHTYAWNGDYDVTLSATMSNGVVVEASQRLGLGGDSARGEGISLSPSVEPPSTDGETDAVSPEELVLTVDAGDTVSAIVGDRVILSGRADTGGQAVELTYLWQQLSGPGVGLDDPSLATTSVTIPSSMSTPAELVFELTVSAGEVSERDRFTIFVSSGTPAPVVSASAGSDQLVAGGSVVLLNGSSSSGTGGGPLTYHWNQSFGPEITISAASSSAPSFVAPAAAADPITLRFTLTVTQGEVSGTDVIQVTVKAVELPDRETMVSMLQELPPLQKVHYSWPPTGYLMLDPDNPLLFEYVRITHAVTLAGGAPKKHRAQAAVQVCKAVNALNPAIPASIAIKYSPWHRVWPENLPPTDFGPEHDASLAQFDDFMRQIRQWLEDAYVLFDAEIPVTAILFDSELFVLKKPSQPGYEEWNAAMTQKYNAFYTIAKSVYPDAKIEWFGRGAIQPGVDITFFGQTQWFTFDEMGDTFNCALYYPNQTQLMIEVFRRTHQNAAAHGVNEIMPWVSLGAGWDLSRTWHSDLEYDVAESWALGAQINDPYYGDRPDQYAPWHAAPIVAFYPRPFNSTTPSWGVHFVAYVRGAHGMAESP